MYGLTDDLIEGHKYETKYNNLITKLKELKKSLRASMKQAHADNDWRNYNALSASHTCINDLLEDEE